MPTTGKQRKVSKKFGLLFTVRIEFPVLLGNKMHDNDCEIQLAIMRAQAGDAQAWDFIIAQMGYIVESVCSRMEIVDAADLSRSDLRQEIWLRVWCKIHTFKCCDDPNLDRSAFGAWLRTTAKNVILSVIEKRRTKKRGFGQNVTKIDPQEIAKEESKTVSGIAEKNEELARIDAAISGLSATDALILCLKYREDKTLHEIAAATSLTLEQVRYRLAKALVHIEQSMS